MADQAGEHLREVSPSAFWREHDNDERVVALPRAPGLPQGDWHRRGRERFVRPCQQSTAVRRWQAKGVSQVRGAPFGRQGGAIGRGGFRGRDGRHEHDGHKRMNGGGPGGIVGIIAKSFTFTGLPLLLTFGSSWYPSRRSSSSSKVTEVGATPMEE